MTVLLPLGAPPVRYSPIGSCWLIEDGSTVPPRAATWRQAFAIAAAYVPPADVRPCRGGRGAVDGRGFDGLDGPTPRSTSSSAPGPSLNPPECDGPGAPQYLLGNAGHRKARRGDARSGTAGAPTG